MERLISKIRIGERCRKEMGDIAALASSIDAVGLMHPVVIDSNNNLIAGERRIRAFEMLGRKKIPVAVIDLAEIVRGEYHENGIREPFLMTEVYAIYLAAGPLEIEAAKARSLANLKRGGASPDKENFLVGKKEQTRDKIGKFCGVSGRTLEKIIAIMEAARDEPERFGDLSARMNKSVNSAFRLLRQRRDETRVLQLVPVVGKYPTLVIDPPWDYEWLSIAGRAAPGYATMTHEKLMALDVAQLASDDCAMYLWVTNNFMTRGVELMKQWGFQHKTVLTWVKTTKDGTKPKWGLGSYFRNTTDQGNCVHITPRGITFTSGDREKWIRTVGAE